MRENDWEKQDNRQLWQPGGNNRVWEEEKVWEREWRLFKVPPSFEPTKYASNVLNDF